MRTKITRAVVCLLLLTAFFGGVFQDALLAQYDPGCYKRGLERTEESGDRGACLVANALCFWEHCAGGCNATDWWNCSIGGATGYYNDDCHYYWSSGSHCCCLNPI